MYLAVAAGCFELKRSATWRASAMRCSVEPIRLGPEPKARSVGL